MKPLLNCIALQVVEQRAPPRVGAVAHARQNHRFAGGAGGCSHVARVHRPPVGGAGHQGPRHQGAL
jgi:hypothetical protein